jgi:hypothetical protein
MSFELAQLVRGNTRAINVTFKQKDGTPYDLTGGSVFCAFTTDKDPSDDTDAAINITPITSFTNPTLGQSRIVLSATQTRIAPNTYFVGIQAVLADGTVLEDTGKIKVTADYKVATS